MPIKRFLSIALITGLTGATSALLLAAEASTQERKDSGGTVMNLSQWKSIEASDTSFDTPLYLPAPIASISHQTRDNRIRHERVILADKKGGATIQSSLLGLYSSHDKVRLNDKDRFTAFLKTIPNVLLGSDSDPVKISHKSALESAGYYAVVQFNGTSRSCFIARSGYKFAPTAYDNDMGNLDTVFFLNYCDTALPVDKLIDLVSRFSSVTDRASYKAALSSAGVKSMGQALATASSAMKKRTFEPSGWKDIPLDDMSFNAALTLNIPIRKARRKVKKDGSLFENIWIQSPYKKNAFRIMHAKRAYESKTRTNINSEEKFISRMKSAMGKEFLYAEPPVTIKHNSKLSGGHYAFLTRSHAVAAKCIFAWTGYHLALNPNDNAVAKLFDTILSLRFCDDEKPKPTMFLEALKSIEYNYDQEAFQVALKSKLSK